MSLKHPIEDGVPHKPKQYINKDEPYDVSDS